MELRQSDPGGIDGTAINFVATRARQQLDEHHHVSPPEGFNAQPPMTWMASVSTHSLAHTCGTCNYRVRQQV